MKEEILLQKIANFKNLVEAFSTCSKGKRNKYGHQNFLFNYGEKLKLIEHELLATKKFKWGGYRRFYVYDPKKRLVMAAPFRDRVVHTAIHSVIEPTIDQTFCHCSYACRVGMGNRNAVVRLANQLKLMGKERYCVKLDVQKYFASVDHEVLYKKFSRALPDESINLLLWSLIRSFPEYSKISRGIPIGNLTSQLFANFYLSGMDRHACSLLGINYDEDENSQNDFYIRYMDDMIIVSREKKKAIEVASNLVNFGKSELKLSIPSHKFMPLSNDPVPFLGFLVNEYGVKPLRRNERKFLKKVKRLKKKNYSLSYRAQVLQSYEAWQSLGLEKV